MTKFFITTLLVGSSYYSLYFAATGTTANRTITCEFHVSQELRLLAADAGFAVARHEALRMGVRRTALADGGFEYELPRHLRNFVPDLLPKQLAECDVDLCAANAATQAACDRFENAVPFRPVRTSRRCVRAKPDAGLPCLRLTEDGGSTPSDSTCNGGCNVMRRAQAFNPATCEPVACSIVSGEDPLTALDENAL